MGRRTKSSQDGYWTLHQRDARDLRTLLDESPVSDKGLITATITSPPYGDLKDYGHSGQIGHGQSYEEYLDDTAQVFAQVHERTADDGSLWLIADTYVEDGPAPRRLLPVPFDLARVAEAVGFTLRDVIVWRKDRTLPWSNGTRLRNAFEYVLLLVKGPDPKYRLDRLRDHAELKSWWVRFPERYNPNGKAPPNVWDIPIPKQGAWGDGEIAHACPLPAELVKRLVLLSSDPDDVIFDPFAGSGVVVAEAERLGRRGLGIELVSNYVDEFHRIIRPEILARSEKGSSNGPLAPAGAKELVQLRILKLPVVLMRGAAKQRDHAAWPLAVVAIPDRRKPGPGRYGTARLSFVVEGSKAQRRAYKQTLLSLLERPPASKFGIDAGIAVVSPSDLEALIAGRRIYLYKNGATSRAVEAVAHHGLLEKLEEYRMHSVPPILSNVHLDVTPRPEAALRE